MKGAKRCVDSRQLHKEGCLQEARVELRGNAGALSISSMSDNEGNKSEGSAGGLLERILDRNNLNLAYKRVKANKGSYGVDRMTVDELLLYLRQNGDEIRQSIQEGTYRPQPVRRVEIPKLDGGIRQLGIPTALDRVIQQAIAQILTPIYEKVFSENSYGFRPGRNAHQAIRKCKEYIETGYNWAVDIDLAKYFDTVNHDKLMNLLSGEIKDGRVLSLIRKYLQSGVMINGVIVETEEGTPQGGNLSPLLSNIMLNELDKELTKRGLKFCRYADDANIYVRSIKAANRVMAGITRFIERVLKLRVNKSKSAVDRPWRLKFLGFSFYHKNNGIGIRVHPKSVNKFRRNIKAITGRSNGKSIAQRMSKLKETAIGWVNYFHIADMRGLASSLDEWTRRRIRMCFWKQWKRIKTRYSYLVRLGTDESKAYEYANTRKGYWRIANSPVLSRTLTNEHLKKLGFLPILERYSVALNSY